MRNGWGGVVAVGLIGLLGAGCASEEDPGPSGPDVMTFIVDGGAPVTYSDDTADVTMMAAENVSDGMNVSLFVPGMIVQIVLDAPLPTSFPAAVPGSLTFIVGGLTYSNGAMTYQVTRLGSGMGDRVEGSFGTTTLNGAGTMTVSGSFSVTRI